MDLKSDVLTLQNQCPKVNPSVSKISLPLQDSYPQGWNQRGRIIPERDFLSGRDETSEEESSLGEIFYPQGWNKRGRIISGREFLSAGMKQARKNHPWKRFFIHRDETSEEESSLEEDFYLQGCNQRGRIILERGFLSAGMKQVRKNHPWERILIRRDETSEEESSLREDFYPQGWSKRGRIIPEREFLSAGMKQARKNHPWERILIRRDEISEEESSLGEDFYPQGWNKRGRIIPERGFLSAGMK